MWVGFVDVLDVKSVRIGLTNKFPLSPTEKTVGQAMSFQNKSIFSLSIVFSVQFITVTWNWFPRTGERERARNEHCFIGFVCNLPTQYVLIIEWDAIGGLQLIHVTANSSDTSVVPLFCWFLYYTIATCGILLWFVTASKSPLTHSSASDGHDPLFVWAQAIQLLTWKWNENMYN